MQEDFNTYLESIGEPVNPERAALASLGDPRKHPSFNEIKGDLRDGDYAFIAYAGSIPVIYFMRPRVQNPCWHTFVATFDGDVIGANMIINPLKRNDPVSVLRSWLEAQFELVHYAGRDMDGYQEPFFVFKSC